MRVVVIEKIANIVRRKGEVYLIFYIRHIKNNELSKKDETYMEPYTIYST